MGTDEPMNLPYWYGSKPSGVTGGVGIITEQNGTAPAQVGDSLDCRLVSSIWQRKGDDVTVAKGSQATKEPNPLPRHVGGDH